MNIEKLAREAGATTVSEDDPQCWIGQMAFDPQTLQHLSALIRAEVLEEAAAVCDDAEERSEKAAIMARLSRDKSIYAEAASRSMWLAAAIRALKDK